MILRLLLLSAVRFFLLSLKIKLVTVIPSEHLKRSESNQSLHPSPLLRAGNKERRSSCRMGRNLLKLVRETALRDSRRRMGEKKSIAR